MNAKRSTGGRTHRFGGDWYAGRLVDDGTLWVFLADVTGHGYYAYLLATSLPVVWQRCWNAHPNREPEPAELLGAMHEMLADCMPDGIFLESLQPVARHAQEIGIDLLIEPEPELLIENAEQFATFMEFVDIPAVGLNFDIGHFYCVRDDPVAAL